MTKVILKNKEGQIAIMSVVEGDVEEAVKNFQESHPEYVDYYVQDEIELPESRQFRDAWTLKNNKIVVDNDKAMEIHKGRIRIERNKKLEELDKEQLINYNDPDKLKIIADKKQVLRDLPATINNLDWPTELT